MFQEEVTQLSIQDICALSLKAAESCSFSLQDKATLRAAVGWCWHPHIDIKQAMLLASLLDMSINFGDKVVLVSEPAGCQSRTVEYTKAGRLHGMCEAINLLGADYAQYL